MGAVKRAGGNAQAVSQSKVQQLPQPKGGDAKQEQAPEEKTRRSCLHKQLRKTKFCMYHLQGVCQFGDSCAFAHSCVELQGAPDLRKTRLCKSFLTGNCKDADCSFAHCEDELRSTDLFYKKSLCMWYEKGRCRNGDQCRFAHGTSELRFRPPQQGEKGDVVAPPPPANSPTGTGAGSRRGGRKNNANSGKRGGGNGGDGNGGSGGSSGMAAQFNGQARAAAGSSGPGSCAGSAASSVAAGAAPFGAGLGAANANADKGGTNERNNLEPMFVQTAPQMPEGLDQLMQYQRQMEQLQRASTAAADMEMLRRYERQMEQFQTASAAAGAASAEVEMLRRYERQMEQIQSASAAAAAAAAGGRFEGARGMALQADLEKLTQNIAALSLQLSRFEMQMQKRGGSGHPALQDVAAGQQVLTQASNLGSELCMLAGASAGVPGPYPLGNALPAATPSASGLYTGEYGLLHA